MTDSERHILGQFENDLNELKDNVLEMAKCAQDNIANAVHGLVKCDLQLCNQAIADDDEVDRLEKLIDHQGMLLIAKYSPVARDLRRIVSTMKMAQALERSSDQASNIAKRAKKMCANDPFPITERVLPIFELVSKQFAAAVEAFSRGDVSGAIALDESDEEIDRKYKELSKTLMKELESNPERTKDYVDLLFVVRFLERIGDYAVNIGEDAVYSESAMDIRHGGELPNQS